MKFFYADTLDHVDPGFNFQTESYTKARIPQRDDVYAHELMAPAQAYDGLLVSRYAFEGFAQQGRYSQAQRQRFRRQGAQRFLRFPEDGRFDPENFPIMADCGAYNYRNDPEPPFSTDDMIEFYEQCGFTHGVSVDHMIGGYDEDLDRPNTTRQVCLPGLTRSIPEDWVKRYEITIANANEMMKRCESGKFRFTPIGVVQGWSPDSYRAAVKSLMNMGYKRIALGGLVPLKTTQILSILESVQEETGGQVGLHLFGISRLEKFNEFQRAGVHSFDSTSPLRQAFKDAKNNYYSTDHGGHYTALRIPQVDDNPKMVARIRSKIIDRTEAVQLERSCLEAVRGLDQGSVSEQETITLLQRYEELFDGNSKWIEVQRTLRDKPWKKCSCPVCSKIGVDVIIFRGSNRNKRRGYHNLWFTHQQLTQFRTEGVEK